MLWALLLVVPLRLYEPPGLRAGPLAHLGSAQPEPDRIGEVNGLLLLRLFESCSSPPSHAADCNSTRLVALTVGDELLKKERVVRFREESPFSYWGRGCPIGVPEGTGAWEVRRGRT